MECLKRRATYKHTAEMRRESLLCVVQANTDRPWRLCSRWQELVALAHALGLLRLWSDAVEVGVRRPRLARPRGHNIQHGDHIGCGLSAKRPGG
eukprot:947146-Prymnesium_polylepis.2